LITKYKSPFSHDFPMFQTTNIFFFCGKTTIQPGRRSAPETLPAAPQALMQVL
jgi:hypothetical protein